MEINKYSDIEGVVVTEDIAEGRMVLFTSASETYNFGSREDLPGVKLPDTATEAAEARYVVTWRVPDQNLPLYIPEPRIGDFALRRGFDLAGNLPLTGTDVHLTWPGQKHGVVIPSGALALAFGQGVFTIPSGHYVHSAAVETPGQTLTVADTSSDSEADSGKLKEGASNVVARTLRYDSDTGDLTVRTFNP